MTSASRTRSRTWASPTRGPRSRATCSCPDRPTRGPGARFRTPVSSLHPKDTMPVLIKIRPAVLVAVAAAFAALMVFVMQGHRRPVTSPSSPVPAGALQVSTAPVAGLTTRQMVDRYTAAVKAAPTAAAYDNLALAELQLAR